MSYNIIRINNNSLVHVEDSNDLALSESDDIVIAPFANDFDDSNHSIIPISKGNMAMLSAALSEVPSIATSLRNYSTLGKTAYSITLKGANVLPDQLFTKANGSHISNLANGNRLGAQTDVNPIDFSELQTMNIANAVFSVASVVTSTYYLKNIDSKLAELNEAIHEILGFLTQEQRDRIQNDYSILLKMKDRLSIYETNEDEKDVALNTLAAIIRDSGFNAINYKGRLEESLAKFRNDKTSRKKKKKTSKRMRGEYCYYSLSLLCYFLANTIKTYITKNFSEDGLEDLISDLTEHNKAFKSIHDEISSAFDKEGPFILMLGSFAMSKSSDFFSLFSKTSEFGKLLDKGADIQDRIIDDAIESKRKEVLIYDRELVDPIIESISIMKSMRNNEVRIVDRNDGSGEGYLLVENSHVASEPS